jgi:CHAT domain-containing protein/Tfp pilus assembly protein PilF
MPLGKLFSLTFHSKLFFSVLFIVGLIFVFDQNPAFGQKGNAKRLKDSTELYMKRGQYGKAVSFARKWVKTFEKQKDTSSLELATAYNALGKSLMNSGELDEAEGFLFKAFRIRKKELGEEHPIFAITLNDLGAFYYHSGNYPKSEPYYVQALEVRKKSLGPESPEVAISYNNLGILYMDMGNYPKAEPFYERALEIRIKVLGDHPYVADSYNNLGLLYYLMGSYSKTEPLYQKALQIRIKVLGDAHPDVAASYVNLGELYMDMGKTHEAEANYLKGLELWKISLGKDHPDLAISYNSLGILLRESGKFKKAEESFLKAEKIRKATLGENHVDLAFTYFWLAGLYEKMGQLLKSEEYYAKALEINKKALGSDHPVVGNNYYELGLLCKKLNKENLAEKFLLEGWSNSLAQFQRNFPFFSEEEKARFLEKQQFYLESLKTFLVVNHKARPNLAGKLFDQQLFTKAILLNSQLKWKQRIKNSSNPELIELFDQWEGTRGILSRLYVSLDSSERSGIDSLEKKAEKLEKVLSQKSETFARLADRKLVTWQEVQSVLKPDEAAIEIIRINTFGHVKILVDSSDKLKKKYDIQGLSDSTLYVALILKQNMERPEMVILQNGNGMDGSDFSHYKKSIARQKLDGLSLGRYWQPIGERLGPEVKKVFFSPDGVYHSLNLNTLYDPVTQKYLIDELDIRMVTVSKDLVEKSGTGKSSKEAFLLGFPEFYSNSRVDSSQIKNSITLKTRNFVGWNGLISDLPGTKIELEKISGLLSKAGWSQKVYIQGQASEEKLKAVNQPRLMHLATHGFFQTDRSSTTNPLLRSGLLLSSAGNTLDGANSKTGEDGILTAYEAMNLDLDNTDLVVLSACETGLGQVKNGEGVFGLQRALKVAGAKSTIMSLWKVDDDATQELMVSFYKHWLNIPLHPPDVKSGQAPKGDSNKPYRKISGNTESKESPLRGFVASASKRSAFLAAQKELKAKFPNPYYWGAFVMVGE